MFGTDGTNELPVRRFCHTFQEACRQLILVTRTSTTRSQCISKVRSYPTCGEQSKTTGHFPIHIIYGISTAIAFAPFARCGGA